MFTARIINKLLGRQNLTRATAPPTKAAPLAISVAAQINGELELLLGYVRDIRAEAQNLMRSLLEIKSTSKVTHKGGRAPELEAALNESNQIFTHNKTQIEERLSALRDLLLKQPELYDQQGDEIARIENLWERVKLNWPNPTEKDDAVIIRQIANVDQDLSELIYHAGYLTIPWRVNQHLEQLRIGQSLDFHSTFEDEMPKPEDRMKILSSMYSHPLVVDGVVDVQRGLIYHASPNPSRRILSYVLMVLTFLAGVLVVALFANLGTWLNLQNWPITSGRFSELLVGYLFITLGGVAHIGIDALKQARANKGQAFLAIEDMLMWVHVKELSIITGIASLIIGSLALAITLPKVEWQMAFFVGYSIDSFIDLFLQRFTETAAISAQTLKGKLG